MRKLFVALVLALGLLGASIPSAGANTVYPGVSCAYASGVVGSLSGLYGHDGVAPWVAAINVDTSFTCGGTGGSVYGAGTAGTLAVTRQTFGGPDVCYLGGFSSGNGEIHASISNGNAKNDAICQARNYPAGLTTVEWWGQVTYSGTTSGVAYTNLVH